MIHQVRGHWIVGGAGEYIKLSMTEYLGACWAEWLAWLNEDLKRSSSTLPHEEQQYRSVVMSFLLPTTVKNIGFGELC
jgi:hypothetical protein